MPQITDVFELAPLNLRPGEGRRLELHVRAEDLTYGGQTYEISPAPMPVVLDISRMSHAGYALRLRFSARLDGPCMRCLEPALPAFEVDVREVNVPGGGEELTSPYVDDAADLDMRAWARDALALTVPEQITCRSDCAGLCPECGANLNEHPGHEHEKAPDPRWAALRDLRVPQANEPGTTGGAE